jgi:hypothetical protein
MGQSFNPLPDGNEAPNGASATGPLEK